MGGGGDAHLPRPITLVAHFDTMPLSYAVNNIICPKSTGTDPQNCYSLFDADEVWAEGGQQLR